LLLAVRPGGGGGGVEKPLKAYERRHQQWPPLTAGRFSGAAGGHCALRAAALQAFVRRTGEKKRFVLRCLLTADLCPTDRGCKVPRARSGGPLSAALCGDAQRGRTRAPGPHRRTAGAFDRGQTRVVGQHPSSVFYADPEVWAAPAPHFSCYIPAYYRRLRVADKLLKHWLPRGGFR